MASNAPHHRFSQISDGIRILVISLFEAAAQECVRIEARQVLVFGTALTMGFKTLRGIFAAHGIETITPETESSCRRLAELIEELRHGKTTDASVRLGQIVRACLQQRPMVRPVVCLSDTELSLAFPGRKSAAVFKCRGSTWINTSVAHVNAAWAFAFFEERDAREFEESSHKLALQQQIRSVQKPFISKQS